VYQGRCGFVCRESDKYIYVELSCGHLVAMLPEEIADVEQADEGTPDNEQAGDKTMSKSTRVANAKGIVPLTGFEEQVEKFARAFHYLSDLEEQVESTKKEFREVANSTARSVDGHVSSVEIQGADGTVVPVSLSDPDKKGNRNQISQDTQSALAKLGFNLDSLDVSETETTMKLTGSFVSWMRGLLAENYTSKGQAIPDEITEKTVTRLTAKGVAKLEKMLAEPKDDNERKAAELLLGKGIKAAAVTVK